MDEIEITVFDEIKDYKEKIYFFNFRQWIFAILIAVIVIPTYIHFPAGNIIFLFLERKYDPTGYRYSNNSCELIDVYNILFYTYNTDKS